MTTKPFRGVYAAVLTPRFDDSALDVQSLHTLLHFLSARGTRRFALNGATGEYCLTTPPQLDKLLRTTRKEFGDAEILCGIGAAGLPQTEELIRVAEAADVNGLLLPMPYFFPYSQDDLAAFSKAVAALTRLPILLYNLPQFTSGLEPALVCELVHEVDNIVGVKDSSGTLDIVTALTQHAPDACRIIGNDSVLAEARQRDVCDGVVSGVACPLPELIAALFQADPASDGFAIRRAELEAFIHQLNAFPTPWGLKWAAEVRGALKARFALPISLERARAAQDFQAWLADWLLAVEAADSSASLPV